MTEKKETYTVLSSKLGGGPHGLGDPNDRSLRKVERDVVIPKLIREKSRAEKCTEEVEEFSQCCRENDLLLFVKCRKENSALKACLAKWYYDPKFVQECKQQYLDERSEYRRTGVSKKERERQKSLMESH